MPAANPGIATAAARFHCGSWLQTCTGEAPKAARIPNSRARPLNEYASNP